MLIIVPYTSIYYDIISSLILWNIIIIIVNLLIHNHHVFGVNIFSLKIPAVPRRNSKSALAMEFLVALGVLHVHWSALWSFVIICACYIYIWNHFVWHFGLYDCFLFILLGCGMTSSSWQRQGSADISIFWLIYRAWNPLIFLNAGIDLRSIKIHSSATMATHKKDRQVNSPKNSNKSKPFYLFGGLLYPITFVPSA